jgi:predicted NACHT family NTPase
LENQALILLDGLDEVIDETTRSKLVEKIEYALEDKAHNSIVITSRPWGYQRDYFRTETFPHFELAQFNDNQIIEFVQKWYESRTEDVLESREMISNLHESLASNNRVSQLVKNPLLLTIVALIHRYQDDLPKRRYELYDKAVSTLLRSWDRKAKGLREQQRDTFKVLDIDDDLRRVMSLLAKWIHEQYATKTQEGGTIIRESDLLGQLSSIIQNDYSVRPHKADEEAKRFVEFIRDLQDS